MSTDTDVALARLAGCRAAKEGRMRAPSLDPTVRDLLGGNAVGDPRNVPILLAFQKGYDEVVDAQAKAILEERAAGDRERCRECRNPVDRSEPGTGWGFCASCLHDALRSGWEPGDDPRATAREDGGDL